MSTSLWKLLGAKPQEVSNNSQKATPWIVRRIVNVFGHNEIISHPNPMFFFFGLQGHFWCVCVYQNYAPPPKTIGFLVKSELNPPFSKTILFPGSVLPRC